MKSAALLPCLAIGLNPDPINQPGDQGAVALHHQGSPSGSPRHHGCRDSCSFGGATEWHHRRLIAVEVDRDALLELMEMAITWPELEYSETPSIRPDRWMDFVESHHWTDPDQVAHTFSVAIDIVMAAVRASR